MAGTAHNEDEEGITGINVTPLVDVMLVLLIIFMVTATLIANQAIKVNLPKVASADDAQVTNLAFVLDKDSKLYLDGTAIEFSDVGKQVADYKAKGKPLQALIAADQATPHGAVIRLIDTVRQNGITDFAINIETTSH